MKKGARVLLPLGSIVVSLLLVEVLCRTVWRRGLDNELLQPEAGAAYAAAGMLEEVDEGGLHYRGRPDAVVTIHDIEYRHNALGLRGSEVGPQKSGFRILVLGDSNTYGWGTRFEDSFVARLGDAMRARNVEVVGAGIPGYDSADEAALYRAIEARVEPDLVIAGWYVNDLMPKGFQIDRHGYMFADLLPIADSLKPWLWSSFAYRRIAISYRSKRFEGGGYDVGSPAGVAASQGALLALKREVEAKGRRFALIDVPWLEPDPTPPGQAKPNTRITAAGYLAKKHSDVLAGFAARNGIPLLPLVPSIEGEHAALLWASIERNDHHPNAKAHARFAAAIADWLIAQKLVP